MAEEARQVVESVDATSEALAKALRSGYSVTITVGGTQTSGAHVKLEAAGERKISIGAYVDLRVVGAVIPKTIDRMIRALDVAAGKAEAS